MRRSWSLAAALLFVVGLVVPSQPTASAAANWDGGVQLYRDGTFTTQHTWTWCTAAGVQIVRNITTDDTDHSRSAQQRYFDWMRGHNRYDLPPEAGVDPAGWTAGMRRFVDDRYRLVADRDFEATLRDAVTNLRATELPVALAVAHGNHGWILTGFTAEADPATTDDPGIETVTIVGPLYGRQSRNGYDMPPGTRLTVNELRRFFTPWRYDPLPMVWDGTYVSIQPIPEAPAPTPSPTPTADTEPHADRDPAADAGADSGSDVESDGGSRHRAAGHPCAVERVRARADRCRRSPARLAAHRRRRLPRGARAYGRRCHRQVIQAVRESPGSMTVAPPMLTASGGPDCGSTQTSPGRSV